VLAGLSLAAAPLPGGPEGTFALDRAASDDVNRAIERTAAEFNFLLRPFARSRLRKANPVPKEIRIVYSPAEVSVQLERYPAIAAPRDGRTIRWTRDDGAVFDLTATTEAGVLRQTFRGEEGERTSVYRILPDGRSLSMQVKISSPRLPKPLAYTLVFRRQG
jgi:hypothetical protein